MLGKERYRLEIIPSVLPILRPTNSRAGLVAYQKAIVAPNVIDDQVRLGVKSD